MYSVLVIIVAAVIAGVLAAAALAAWSWARYRGRFALVGIATAISWIAWHLLLNVTHARRFEVDAPIIRLCWEDVGSGVATLFTSALILGLVTERQREHASRVVDAAAIAGLVAMTHDILV